MIKYILPLFLITGCAVPASTPEPVTPVQVATDAIENTKTVYKCEQETVTEKLVWVACEFINKDRFVQNDCVQVSYFHGNDEVVRSRRVCTGPLAHDQANVNYVAFTNEKRSALVVCGADLALCKLAVRKAE